MPGCPVVRDAFAAERLMRLLDDFYDLTPACRPPRPSSIMGTSTVAGFSSPA
jgi:hypothetical protein